MLHLQALVISLVPANLLDAAAAAATSEDPSAANWLPDLMRWFHRTFTLTSSAYLPSGMKEQQHQKAATTAGSSSAAAATAGSWHHELLADLGLHGSCGVSVLHQLLCCASAKKGSSAQLVSLLVAALRGIGFLTRSVW